MNTNLNGKWCTKVQMLWIKIDFVQCGRGWCAHEAAAHQFSPIRPLARLRAAHRRQYGINYSNNNHKNKTYFAYKLLHRWNTRRNADGWYPTTIFEKCMRMQLGGARHLHKYSAVYFCLDIPQSICWNVRRKKEKSEIILINVQLNMGAMAGACI